MTASLEAAIFSVPGLGVDDLATVFTLDSAHTGVAINEIPDFRVPIVLLS